MQAQLPEVCTPNMRVQFQIPMLVAFEVPVHGHDVPDHQLSHGRTSGVHCLLARDAVDNHLLRGPDRTPVPPVPPTPVTQTWERLGSIDQPVLAIGGGLDSYDHRAMCRHLAEAVPEGQYVEVAGTGHYPNLEDPEVFDQAVRDYLERHGL